MPNETIRRKRECRKRGWRLVRNATRKRMSLKSIETGETLIDDMWTPYGRWVLRWRRWRVGKESSQTNEMSREGAVRCNHPTNIPPRSPKARMRIPSLCSVRQRLSQTRPESQGGLAKYVITEISAMLG